MAGDVIDLIADSHNIFGRCGTYFSKIFNELRISQIRQREIQTPLPQVQERSASEFELAIGKLKRHKSPSIF